MALSLFSQRTHDRGGVVGPERVVHNGLSLVSDRLAGSPQQKIVAQ